jgi:predicted permease
MAELLQDLRYGLRMLIQKPAFTAVALLSLTLGIGANSFIFSIVDALLLRSLPVERPERLITIYTSDRKNPGLAPLSHLNWKDLRAQNEVFTQVLGFDWTPMSVSTGSEATFLIGQLVSGNYFDTLGVRAARGRTFAVADDREGAGQSVTVLSHRFWRDRLGSDPHAVGRTLLVNGEPFTVIGVAPAAFTGTDAGVQPELWVPMATNPILKPAANVNWYGKRRGLFVNTIGRLREGVTIAQARGQISALARRLEKDFPGDNHGRSLSLAPLADSTINPTVRGAVVTASAVLATIAGLVLLIACANVANLLLARASARQKEIAVRLALGAGRRRLIRQLLTESVLLGVAGGAGGLLLALWAGRSLPALLARLPVAFTPALAIEPEPRLLAFALLLSLATSMLFGIVPAVQTTRHDVVTALKSQRTAAGHGRRRLSTRGLLVVSQVALSLVALVAAGLFVRSLGAAEGVDPGFDSRGLIAMSFNLDLQRYRPVQGESFVREVLDRVRNLPGVSAATVAQAGPLQGTVLRSVFLNGAEPAGNGVFVPVDAVGPHYFETLGIPLLRGRGFVDGDRRDSPPVVVVNQTMAEKLWANLSPIGRRFRFHGDDFEVEVVGVAKTIKYTSLSEQPQPYVYQPLAQRYSGNLTLLVRTGQRPESLLQRVEREVRSIDKQLPLTAVGTVPQLLGRSLWARQMGASLLAVFGVLALVLAAVGIYGVMSFAVSQRSREIGVRVALGATRQDVIGLVLGQGMAVAAVGVITGVALALTAARYASSILYGVSPWDLATFGGSLLVLALVAVAANFLPARRATAVDPISVLRLE